MGVFDSSYRQSLIDTARNPVRRLPAGFIEAFTATYESTKQEDLSISESLNIGRKRIERREKIKELTGEDISALEGLAVPQMALSEIGRSARGQQAVTRYQTKLVELASRYPEIKTDPELLAEIVEDSRRKREKTGKVMENSTFSGKLGSFAGAMSAVMQDPLVLGSMLFGVGTSAGILRKALIDGGINVGSEVLVQPLVFQYKQKLGSPFTVGEAATRVAAAGAGGFLLAGTVKGIARGVSSLVKPRVPGVDDLLETFERGVKQPTELQSDAAAVVADYADVIRESPFDLADPVATQRHLGATAKAISDVESGNPVDVTDTLRGLEPREEVRGELPPARAEEPTEPLVPDFRLEEADEIAARANALLRSLHTSELESYSFQQRIPGLWSRCPL